MSKARFVMIPGNPTIFNKSIAEFVTEFEGRGGRDITDGELIHTATAYQFKLRGASDKEAAKRLPPLPLARNAKIAIGAGAALAVAGAVVYAAKKAGETAGEYIGNLITGKRRQS